MAKLPAPIVAGTAPQKRVPPVEQFLLSLLGNAPSLIMQGLAQHSQQQQLAKAEAKQNAQDVGYQQAFAAAAPQMLAQGGPTAAIVGNALGPMPQSAGATGPGGVTQLPIRSTPAIAGERASQLSAETIKGLMGFAQTAEATNTARQQGKLAQQQMGIEQGRFDIFQEQANYEKGLRAAAENTARLRDEQIKASTAADWARVAQINQQQSDILRNARAQSLQFAVGQRQQRDTMAANMAANFAAVGTAQYAQYYALLKQAYGANMDVEELANTYMNYTMKGGDMNALAGALNPNPVAISGVMAGMSPEDIAGFEADYKRLGSTEKMWAEAVQVAKDNVKRDPSLRKNQTQKLTSYALFLNSVRAMGEGKGTGKYKVPTLGPVRDRWSDISDFLINLPQSQSELTDQAMQQYTQAINSMLEHIGLRLVQPGDVFPQSMLDKIGGGR